MTREEAVAREAELRALGLAPVSPLRSRVRWMVEAGLKSWILGPVVHAKGITENMWYVPAVAAQVIRCGLNVPLRKALLRRFLNGQESFVEQAVAVIALSDSPLLAERNVAALLGWEDGTSSAQDF